MNTRDNLVEMKKQLAMMFDEAIANYDKAIERQKTREWADYADEWGYPITFLEECMDHVGNLVDKLVDSINEELYAFEEVASVPFEEFI